MRPAQRVAKPPETPLLVFDGDCGFCRIWIARWKEATGDRLAYAPSQEVASRFPEISPEAFRRSVQLVLPDGRVFEGAEAVARALAVVPGRGVFLWIYRSVPGATACAELAYRLIASHRAAALVVTRLLWGSSVTKPTYLAATALFLRLLGLTYLVAFVSLWVQIDGLVGSQGILPIARYLDWVRSQTGAERYWLAPTLCWISGSDGFLHLLCGAGTLAGLTVLLGFAPALGLAAAWLCYLSLSNAGQVFLEFQWDLLLLETGLLAVLLVSPRQLRLGMGVGAPRLVRVLLCWLLFRLLFSSGWVKLASGDPTWRNLTALRYHYETQPLPPWTAWFMHRLPASFHSASVLFLFFVELAVPFLFFAPRRLRIFGFLVTALFQALMAATGNYAFFNLLTVALALLLLDDQSLPRRLSEKAAAAAVVAPRRGWPRWLLTPLAIVLLLVSSAHFAATLRRSLPFPHALLQLVRWCGPLRSANGYGLFAVMTTSRPEIVIEGSDDGKVWRPYEFRWKPGDLRRRPRFVAPHQPRLDWQMWFAALGSYEENPWLLQCLGRLLAGSPAVERLLAGNPFPGHPPRFIRAALFDYRFSDADERRRTGSWWRRESKGLYVPPLSLENFRATE